MVCPVDEARADSCRAEGGGVGFLEFGEGDLGFAFDAPEEGGEAAGGGGGAVARDVNEVEGGFLGVGVGVGCGREGLEGGGGGEGEGFGYGDVLPGGK